MSAIKSLFKKLPNGTPATVIELEEKLSKAEADLAENQAAASDAYLDGKDARHLQARVAELKAERERLHGALAVARDRVARNAEIEAAEETDAAWRKTEKLARQRTDLSVEMEVCALKLADYFKELAALNEEMYHAAPVRIGSLHNSPLSASNIEMALRLYLLKNGFKWAADYPWNPKDIALFSDKIKTGNAEILSKRPKKDAA